MGMSCFLVQNCTRFTKVLCFSVHFCSRLSAISCFVCFFACFCTSVCVILCLCAAVCGREFLSRVYILMQFYDVLREPFMGMSCFFDETWVCNHKSLMFVRLFLPPAVANPYVLCVFICIFCRYVCVLRCALQSVACSSSVELVISCNFTVFSESRLWECRVFLFKN